MAYQRTFFNIFTCCREHLNLLYINPIFLIIHMYEMLTKYIAIKYSKQQKKNIFVTKEGNSALGHAESMLCKCKSSLWMLVQKG